MRLFDPKLSVSPDMANYLCTQKSILGESDNDNVRAGYSHTIANDLTPAGQEPRKEVDEQLERHLPVVCRQGRAPIMNISELYFRSLSYVPRVYSPPL
jgi:hypothetical protein